MNNNSIFLSGQNLESLDPGNCNLLMSITENSFSYAVTCNDASVKMLFDAQNVTDVEGEIAAQLALHPELSSNYYQVKIACSGSNELLVPAALFNSENNEWVKQYFTGNFNGSIYSNKETLGFYPVFEVSRSVDDLLNNAFAGSNVKFHAVTPLLQLVYQDGFYINFTAQSASFLYVNDDKVVYQNTFGFENAAEFNYFLLLALNTLKIEAGIPALITGIINEGDEKFKILQKYFSSIQFLVQGRVSPDDEVLNNLPLHYFSALLALDLCE